MYTIENETISLRDYFAAKAMQSYVTSLHSITSYLEPIARHAYALADVMLEERDKDEYDAASPTGCDLITAERKRHTDDKMYRAEVDDKLAQAISFLQQRYALLSNLEDRKTNLIKAGALIAAEIDRLIRVENKNSNSESR